jgi:hypothetical protein
MPSEFYEITDNLLLTQPEPQMFYWLLWQAAMQVSLVPQSSLGLPLPGRTIVGVGAPFIQPDRDRLILAEPMFQEVIAAKVDFNKMPGQTIKFNRPVFTDTTYTLASRRITGTISTTPINVQGQQTDLTLFRYGGPYSTDQGAVAPYGIRAFDSNVGVHNAASIHGTHLARDFHRFIDAVHVVLLDNAATTVYPDGMTTADSATTANSFPMSYRLICNLESRMDTANLGTFRDGFRALVCTPDQKQQLRGDVDYQRASQFFQEMNILFGNTYFGSVNKFHLFVDNTLTITPNTSSVNIHYGHALSPGALLDGMGRPPVTIPNTNDNYGEDVLVIWKADLAFALANNSLIYRFGTTASA